MTAPLPSRLDSPLNQIAAVPCSIRSILRPRACVDGIDMCSGDPGETSAQSCPENRLCHATRDGTNGGTVSVLRETPSAPSVFPEKPIHLGPNQDFTLMTSRASGAYFPTIPSMSALIWAMSSGASSVSGLILTSASVCEQRAERPARVFGSAGRRGRLVICAGPG